MRLIVLILLACNLAMIQAQSYYVSTTGSDSNPGSLSRPWRTFQKACDTATPGSTVYLRGGSYGPAFINVSGLPGQEITLTNYQSEVAIIDGGSTNSQTLLLFIANQRHIRVEGLVFQHAEGNFSAGIYITDRSDHITLVNNKISQINFSSDPNAPVVPSESCFPVIVYNEHPSDACTSITIEANEVMNCRTGYAEAVSLVGNVDGFLIKDNKVHDITNIGIDVIGGYGTSPDPATDMARNGTVTGNETYRCISPYAASAGIYVDGGHHVVVERNRSHHNRRGFEVGAEQQGHVTRDVVVRNNIAYANQEPGMTIGGYDFPNTGKVVDCVVRHNTFHENNTNDLYAGELFIEYTEDCTIEQNIFSAANSAGLLLVARLNSIGLELNHNAYHLDHTNLTPMVDWNGTVSSYDGYRINTGQDGGSLLGDPQFVDAAQHDYALTISSPCVNAGRTEYIPSAGALDYAGNRRLVGTVDIGAHEYAGPCMTVITLSSPIYGRGFYHSASTLSATSVLTSAADVVLTAPDGIDLLPGFEVEQGGRLDASALGCP